ERGERLEGGALALVGRQGLPDLLGGERTDRAQDERERLGEAQRGRLRRAADGVGRAPHVQRVLADVAPERREVGRRELEEAPRDGVERVRVVSGLALLHQARGAVEEEAVERLEGFVRDGILLRTE